MLLATGGDELFTQESKYILQEYLKTREPGNVGGQDADLMIVASEFNEWLSAYSRASSTPSVNASQLTVNYIKSSNDPFKIASAITLSTDEVRTSIRGDGPLSTQITSKLRLARDSSLKDQEKQFFDSALTILSP